MSQDQNPKCLNNSHSHNLHKTCIWGFGVSVVSTYSVLIHLYVVIEIIGLHRAVIPVMNNLINTICFLIVTIHFIVLTLNSLIWLNEPQLEVWNSASITVWNSASILQIFWRCYSPFQKNLSTPTCSALSSFRWIWWSNGPGAFIGGPEAIQQVEESKLIGNVQSFNWMTITKI